MVSFKSEDTADQVLNKLQAMQKENLIDLEDAVVAVRDGNGKVRLKHAVDPRRLRRGERRRPGHPDGHAGWPALPQSARSAVS